MKMNKTLVMPLAMALVMTVGANFALSAPQKGSMKPPAPTAAQKKQFEKDKKSFDKLTPEEKQKKLQEMHDKKSQEFDKELGLTDEQKAKAKEIRLKGQEQIKPTMEQIKAKKDKIQEVRKSSLSDAEKEKQINAIRAELKPLKEKANEIRKQNMVEFEGILTADQKTKLKEMKKNSPKKPHHGPKGPDCKKGPKDFKDTKAKTK